MKWVLVSAIVALMPVTAQAEMTEKEVVLDCVARMDVQTTWDHCRTLMFQPCVSHEVGGEDHLACLEKDRTEWVAVMENRQAGLGEILTTEGNLTLIDLIGQWFGFVGHKCTDVGKEKAAISEDAGRRGCEISELVGLTAELEACRDGRSDSPYCTIRE